MKLFKRKKYYYLFEYNQRPELIKANSMQEAIDKIFQLWFFGGSNARIVFKFSNDASALIGDHVLEHNRSFFNSIIEAKPI